MKKSLLALLLPLTVVSLTGCVKYNGRNKDGSPKGKPSTPTNTEAPTDTPSPIEPGKDVTYYLNLGEFGVLNETVGSEIVPTPGTNIEAARLEHGLQKSGKSGDVLPDKTKVKSTQYNVEFKYWLLSGTQHIYTQVPDENGAILVAVFGEIASYERVTRENAPNMGYGFKFNNNTYYVGSRCESTQEGEKIYQQYCIHNAFFRKGETFQFFDFGSWDDDTESYGVAWTGVTVDPWSFGGDDQSKSTLWANYFIPDGDHYKVLKDFTSESIYIKVLYREDEVYFSK